MLEKLNDRYRYTSTASKITNISFLASARCKSLKSDMARYIYRMAVIGKELCNMDSKLDDTLNVDILVASLEIHELAPVTTVIIMLSKKGIAWKSVA